MQIKAFRKIGFLVALGVGISGLADAASQSPTTKKTNTTPQIIKLEPQIRVEAAVIAAERSIPTEALRPFLNTSLIFESKKQFKETPYIIAQPNGHTEGGALGTILYVQGIKEAEEPTYNIYKEGKLYKHPVTKEMLGFEALAIGTAELQSVGDVAQFKITKALESVENGARLLPSFVSTLPTHLIMRPAKYTGDGGFILSVRDGLDQIGRNQIVVISLGKREGIQEGNVLDIYQTGKRVRDPESKGWRVRTVQLPDTRVGSVLVFQTHEKLSLALVIEATEVIHLLDKLKGP